MPHSTRTTLSTALSTLARRPVRALRSLALVVPLALAACASPTGAEDGAQADDAPAVDDEGTSTNGLRILFRPDFVALSYGTGGYGSQGGCRDGEGKFHFRFYLKNQGNLAGMIPMTKLHISVPWSDNPNLPDITTYVFETSLAAGETKLIDVVVPFGASFYPTTYQVEVQADVANVVKELSELNNVLVTNTMFWNGLPQQQGNCN